MEKPKKLPKKEVSKSNNSKEAQIKKHAASIITRNKIEVVGLALLLGIIFAFGAGVIYLNTAAIDINEKTPAFIKFFVLKNKEAFPQQDMLAAVINGENITMSDLDSWYKFLVPEQYYELVEKKEVLLVLINKELLMQEAKSKNYTITDEETESEFEEMLLQNGISIEEFEQTLVSKGITLGFFKEYYKEEILQSKLLEDEVLKKISVTSKDIEKYYSDNKDAFTIPERINVSHILVCHNESIRCVSNLTKEEAIAKASEIREMLNSTNFAEIAMAYSDEPAATITGGMLPGNLIPGYVTRQDGYDTDFLDAAFAVEPGNVSMPVETVFGYHLINVFGRLPEEPIEISLVYDQINQTLTEEKQNAAFSQYIGALKNSSVIINYLEKED